jgi:hypothetical protein
MFLILGPGTTAVNWPARGNFEQSELKIRADDCKLAVWGSWTWQRTEMGYGIVTRFPSALSTSLRANGSRECAPDDRLREAIQEPKRKTGLLRRKCSSQ